MSEMTLIPTPPVADGLVAVVKRDCPTCELVTSVLEQVAAADPVVVFTQDDPLFPENLSPTDDTNLDFSWHHHIETVPTLLRFVDGVEQERIVGWSREQWESFTGLSDLGPGLPDHRPGCGSLSVDPTLSDMLAVRFRGDVLVSKRIEIAELEDEMEAAFDRGWSDGLPVIPATEARVLRMLDGTSRGPQEVVGIIPPNLVEATVEQVAINAVMAGCKPEYFPVVLAAVEAACRDEFNLHGLLATTYFAGPVMIVNGPITKRINMNSDGNVFGQGNRANMTIGRALQLVVRNLGGGRPGEVDMAVQGSSSKLGLCFAEREYDSPFTSLATERGTKEGTDALTLFAGFGPTPIIDQLSRTPESLARSFAEVLKNMGHPKLVIGFDSMLVISPEHGHVFADAGWDKARLRAELDQLLTLNTDDLIRGANDIAEGLPEAFAGSQLPKYRAGGLHIVHAGGNAGLFSSVLGGWVAGAKGSEPVTAEIAPWT